MVVGAGYGGATAAKYIRMWSGGKIDVTVIEREAAFVSCPVSNLVIGGSRTLADITVPFDGLRKWGVRVVRDEALDIDPVARTVKLARGEALAYDRLILSPGVDFIYDDIPSLATAAAQDRVLHAWKAGPQTARLARAARGDARRRRFRDPHSQGALSMSAGALRARVPGRALFLDEQEKIPDHRPRFQRGDPVQEGALRRAHGNPCTRAIIDYRPNSSLVDVDLATRTLKLDFDDVRADVINVIPPQRAGAIARRLGMANANDRFCQVDFLTYESTAQRGIHVLGDSIQVAPLMPKSGHMANQHAKVCAAAVVALLSGAEVNPMPVIANTCYSYVDDKQVGHVTSVHAYDRAQKTMLVVPGSGGLSLTANEGERVFAEAWARNIWADMLM